MRTGDTPAENVARRDGDGRPACGRSTPRSSSSVGDGPLADDGRWWRRAGPRVRGDGDAQARAASTPGSGARTSLLVDYTARGAGDDGGRGARRARRRAGALSDDRGPGARCSTRRCNRYRLETLNLAVHSPLVARDAPRELHVPEAALPHRGQPGPAPPHGAGLAAADDPHRHRAPRLRDAPADRRATPRALEVYAAAMERAWAAKNRLLDMGVPLEAALYLLPNAKALRFHETGSLLYLAHKWVMRTCFNAQEEIYRASMDELDQVRAVHPRLARHMGPPCVLRARPHHADLHRGRALLRRARVAQLPRRRAPDLSGPRARCCPAGAACPVPGREVRSEDLEALTRDAVLSRGLGRSYGDSSLPAARPTRVAAARPWPTASSSFDPATGVAARGSRPVAARAINRLFLPRGFFSPVTPGHAVRHAGRHGGRRRPRQEPPPRRLLRRATCARCGMRVADGRIVECSPSGGAGPLPRHHRRHGPHRPHPRGRVPLTRVPVALDRPWRASASPTSTRFIEALKAAAREWPYTMGWIDCLSRGPRHGRGHPHPRPLGRAGARRRRMLPAPLRRPARARSCCPGSC